MLKRFIFTVFTLFSIFSSNAQLPVFYLSWDKRYGGAQDDAIAWFEKTNDGGLIIGGTSYSGISGDKSEPNHDPSLQSSDFWLVKTDAQGLKIWDKRLGGTSTDLLLKLSQTTDGGYIAGGTTYSGVGGDKSQPNWDPTGQSNDYWIIKTDANGNKVWDKRFGGTTFDLFASVKQTPDGGYIMCGSTFSDVSGDVTQPTKGSWDYWVVRTDQNGTKLWDKRFGGADDDFATGLDLATSGGGFIIGGYSKSMVSGDKTQPSQGNWDYWVVRIDNQGNIIWDKTFGGNYADWLFDIIKTSDGGFLLGGQSFSQATGDKTEPNHDPTPAGSDRWIVKINSLGTKMWDRTFGGDQVEDLTRVAETADGGFLLSGESYSSLNGDKSEANLGTEQTWVLKTSSAGLFEWDKTIFSYGHDEKGTALMYDSLCFVAVNYTTADTGGYKSEFTQGNGDFWITKVCMEDPSFVFTPDNNDSKWNIFPNPASELLHLHSSINSLNEVRYEITDLKGSLILTGSNMQNGHNHISIDVSSLPDGFYICRIFSDNLPETKKFVIGN